jgi:hypothetical protein
MAEIYNRTLVATKAAMLLIPQSSRVLAKNTVDSRGCLHSPLMDDWSVSRARSGSDVLRHPPGRLIRKTNAPELFRRQLYFARPRDPRINSKYFVIGILGGYNALTQPCPQDGVPQKLEEGMGDPLRSCTLARFIDRHKP